MAFTELPKGFDAGDSGTKATKPLIVDMSDPKSNEVLKGKDDVVKGKAAELAADQPEQKVEKKDDKPAEKPADGKSSEQERLRARLRVVEDVCDQLKSGNFGPDTLEAKVVGAAIAHQIKYGGGVKAADSLAGDITAGLPKGMKLEIKQDADFEKKVKNYCIQTGMPVPDYIRVVTLTKDGKEVGRAGITCDTRQKVKPER